MMILLELNLLKMESYFWFFWHLVFITVYFIIKNIFLKLIELYACIFCNIFRLFLYISKC